MFDCDLCHRSVFQTFYLYRKCILPFQTVDVLYKPYKPHRSETHHFCVDCYGKMKRGEINLAHYDSSYGYPGRLEGDFYKPSHQQSDGTFKDLERDSEGYYDFSGDFVMNLNSDRKEIFVEKQHSELLQEYGTPDPYYWYNIGDISADEYDQQNKTLTWPEIKTRLQTTCSSPFISMNLSQRLSNDLGTIVFEYIDDLSQHLQN